MGDVMDYVMIVGEGRSGTNWLLDLFDASPQTHCRNEPNILTDTSPMAKLPTPFVPKAETDAVLEREWDDAVRWTASRLGAHDPKIDNPKSHVYELGRRMGVHRTMNQRARKILKPLVPSLRGGEWPLPWWVGSRSNMAKAKHVIKLVQIPAWATWVLRRRPECRVVHIVRHPGGFLNSWRTRFLPRLPLDVTLANNHNRLKAIRAQFPEWGERFGDVDAMDVVESELWYWRYASETINAAGKDRPANYQRLLYEEVAADPAGVAKRMYEFGGVEWTADVEQRIRAVSSKAEALAVAWRSKMSASDVASIEKVMRGSIMEHWWDAYQAAAPAA